MESPSFNRLLEEGHFGEWERDIAIALNRDGFAVIDFPDPDIDARISRIRSEFSDRFGIEDSDPGARKRSGAMREQDAWRNNHDVRAIATNPDILSLLSRLYGRAAFAFQTLNFPVGTQQPLHSDAVHFSSLPERFMCGVWLAMEDMDEDNGPLRYVPGSHQWPIVNNAMIGRKGWQSELSSAQKPYAPAWDTMISAHGAQSVEFHARKGQALIWCANLLHGGSKQADPLRTRWSQVTHYYFENCIYYTPAYSDEPLGRLALRDAVDIADGKVRPHRFLGEPVSAGSSVRQRMAQAWRRMTQGLR